MFECGKNNVMYFRHPKLCPIKLCKTAGSIHLFKIKGTLKTGNIKLNKKITYGTY